MLVRYGLLRKQGCTQRPLAEAVACISDQDTLTSTHSTQFRIQRLIDLPDAPGVDAALDRILFATSNVQAFENDDARTMFRERWLGRYLEHDPAYAYIAVREDAVAKPVGACVVGYLVGALDDPAQAERFQDLGYFQAFQTETLRFPAQLHVNVLDEAQGQGLGQKLVEAFVRDATKAGAPGVHVVTSEGARNVTFYNRCGFHEVAQAEWNGRIVVLLGRTLNATDRD